MPQPLRLPPRSELPDGPRRDLTEELFAVYTRAGRPSLRDISDGLVKSEIEATASYETIRRALTGRGPRPPRWEAIEGIYLWLCQRARPRIDPDALHPSAADKPRREHLLDLWNQAVEADNATPSRIDSYYVIDGGTLPEHLLDIRNLGYEAGSRAIEAVNARLPVALDQMDPYVAAITLDGMAPGRAVAALLDQMDSARAAAVLNRMDPDQAVRALHLMEAGRALAVLDLMGSGRVAAVLNQIDPVLAADVLDWAGNSRAAAALARMDSDRAAAVRQRMTAQVRTDLSDGQAMETATAAFFPGEFGPVFSPDGHLLVTTSTDTTEQIRILSPPHVLALAEEWFSSGSLTSALNRHLCVALAELGVRVTCYVPNADESERADAAKRGVELVAGEPLPGTRTPWLSRLQLRPRIPRNVQVDAVFGYGRITGPAAFIQARDHFPAAKQIHFLHIAPDETEIHKDDHPGAGGTRTEHRTRDEIDLARCADHVVAVGPRLHARYAAELHPGATPLRLDPGFDPFTKTSSMPPPGVPFRVLVSAGLADPLKGMDLAARAMGGVAHDAFFRSRQVELIARVASDDEIDRLRNRLAAAADEPTLGIILRAPDPNRLTEELTRASLVLLPSRVEGFDLVGLEAIAAGVPILVSTNSGLGEFLTEAFPYEAGRYVVPMIGRVERDQTAWEDMIRRVLMFREEAFEHAATLRDALLHRGWTWDRAARVLLDQLGLPTLAGTATTLDRSAQRIPDPGSLA